MVLISCSSTGSTRMDTSRSSSTSVPPAPTVITLPNVGSVFPPMISSRPGASCCTTITLSITAPGTRVFTSREIVSKASAASAGVLMLRITPPASLLWTTCCEITFITTG